MDKRQLEAINDTFTKTMNDGHELAQQYEILAQFVECIAAGHYKSMQDIERIATMILRQQNRVLAEKVDS